MGPVRYQAVTESLYTGGFFSLRSVFERETTWALFTYYTIMRCWCSCSVVSPQTRLLLSSSNRITGSLIKVRDERMLRVLLD